MIRQINQQTMQNAMARQAKFPSQPQQKSQRLPNEIEKLVDQIFSQLFAACPAMRSQFDEAQLPITKRTWVLGFAENNIRTIEQVRAGMRKVRSKSDDYFPGVGKFISWCKQDRFEALGLPSEEELYQRLKKFQSYGMLEIHKFHFESDAEYWLLTDLYCDNREATEKELRKAVGEALDSMATRLEAGETLPKPQITLPKKPSFVPPERQREINLRGIAVCKTALGIL
ncbi:Replication protein P [uncultured Avibacterium sp.]|uniref:Replication protein P n=1 Tax=uncultured Avibacterium sp. TaxID=1936169 RepID=A0A486XBX7_9PAST|nr:Replication protein P [uncultured Avibacterium sp.]